MYVPADWLTQASHFYNVFFSSIFLFKCGRLVCKIELMKKKRSRMSEDAEKKKHFNGLTCRAAGDLKNNCWLVEKNIRMLGLLFYLPA